jgi:preprotein translocase subunit SecE
MLAKVTNFLREVKFELKKSSWPTRRELTDATIIVIIATVILSTYVGMVDLILSKVVSLVIR